VGQRGPAITDGVHIEAARTYSMRTNDKQRGITLK
jgi:hypothetical protein